MATHHLWITYNDPGGIWDVVEAAMQPYLPLKKADVESPPIDFIAEKDPKLNIPNDVIHWWRIPFAHLFVINSEDEKAYKAANMKTLMREWTKAMIHDKKEWLVLYCPLGNKTAKQDQAAKAHKAVIEHIHSDMPSTHGRDRFCLIRLQMQETGAQQSWEDTLNKLRECLAQSYSQRCEMYSNALKTMHTSSQHAWSFCDTFVAEEGLAFVHEQYGQLVLAFNIYEKLESDLLADSLDMLKPVSAEFNEVVHDIFDLGLDYRQMIHSKTITRLNFRIYVLVRQILLLLRLGESADAAQRALLYVLRDGQYLAQNGCRVQLVRAFLYNVCMSAVVRCIAAADSARSSIVGSRLYIGSLLCTAADAAVRLKQDGVDSVVLERVSPELGDALTSDEKLTRRQQRLLAQAAEQYSMGMHDRSAARAYLLAARASAELKEFKPAAMLLMKAVQPLQNDGWTMLSAVLYRTLASYLLQAELFADLAHLCIGQLATASETDRSWFLQELISASKLVTEDVEDDLAYLATAVVAADEGCVRVMLRSLLSQPVPVSGLSILLQRAGSSIVTEAKADDFGELLPEHNSVRVYCKDAGEWQIIAVKLRLGQIKLLANVSPVTIFVGSSHSAVRVDVRPCSDTMLCGCPQSVTVSVSSRSSTLSLTRLQISSPTLLRILQSETCTASIDGVPLGEPLRIDATGLLTMPTTQQCRLFEVQINVFAPVDVSLDHAVWAECRFEVDGQSQSTEQTSTLRFWRPFLLDISMRTLPTSQLLQATITCDVLEGLELVGASARSASVEIAPWGQPTLPLRHRSQQSSSLLFKLPLELDSCELAVVYRRLSPDQQQQLLTYSSAIVFPSSSIKATLTIPSHCVVSAPVTAQVTVVMSALLQASLSASPQLATTGPDTAENTSTIITQNFAVIEIVVNPRQWILHGRSYARVPIVDGRAQLSVQLLPLVSGAVSTPSVYVVVADENVLVTAPAHVTVRPARRFTTACVADVVGTPAQAVPI
eukprot:TRINITY_DN1324_c0_g1_i1.p1 TRINITY_DN1324_c0_g1~~TRINITY_DN1324_c0_g1_i1.p1  ORF type:complete len:1000 (-),score=242.48 TRINITY_DN1324_c0_g1_i1:914-3913(-)